MSPPRIVPDKELEMALPPRFLSKVLPEPNSGCWLWMGAVNTTGYATFWFEGKSHAGHRFLYERLFGPQPGLEIDHECRVPSCVNPQHLESVTVEENNRRRTGLGKGNRKKTACRNGHPLSGANLETIVTPAGQTKRRCIICRNATQRAYNARKAGRRADCD
jgi:hypothetical protein